ncbi:unnamed protein product [Dicrocoelium dendriticum]|nr:unnamed protein product [Dicrocoelium dendriticum]
MWLQRALLVLCQVHLAVKGNTFLKEFRMPGIRVYKSDAYVCYAEPLPRGKSYITSFQPIYNEIVTHHMLLFACQEKPTTDSNPWNCDNEMVSQPVCAGNSMILFSWAMNAPGFKMPNDTSIPVGGTVYDYLVLQVHYKDIKYFAASPDHTDSSGWLLTMQTTPSKYLAGIYLFVMDGAVRPFGFSESSVFRYLIVPKNCYINP